LIKIFDKNKYYIIADFQGDEKSIKQYTQELKKLDNRAICCFLIGIILASILAVSLILKSKCKGIMMENKSIIRETLKEINNSKNESFNGITSLKINTRSFDGMTKLKPKDKNNSNNDNQKK
jgi:hypothetical protein